MQNACIFIFKTYSLKELKILKLFLVFFSNLFKDSIFLQFYILPKKIKRFTVIRSPHVFKESREQFEIISYKVVMKFNIVKDRNKFYFYLLNLLNNKTSYIHKIQSNLNIVVFVPTKFCIKF
jgi:hypothetical protein